MITLFWPLRKKEELKEDISRVFNIEKEEINIERMTDDVRHMLKHITKEIDEGNIQLSETEKNEIRNAILSFEEQVNIAKQKITNLANRINALKRRMQ
ncbi:MAG: hypothetical protein N3D84_01635 [Candidatus Woesearchaeota archaeon]|nr:hypothetical protein [Candidatus Woesearchaeota archaeon]